jgi:hypothetical protein
MRVLGASPGKAYSRLTLWWWSSSSGLPFWSFARPHLLVAVFVLRRIPKRPDRVLRRHSGRPPTRGTLNFTCHSFSCTGAQGLCHWVAVHVPDGECRRRPVCDWPQIGPSGTS